MGNQHRSFEWYDRRLPTTPPSPFPKWGLKYTPRDMSNFDWSVPTGYPIHFMFHSRVGFSGATDRMALFPVRSNPRWRQWHDMTWHDRRYRQEPSDVVFCQITSAIVILLVVSFGIVYCYLLGRVFTKAPVCLSIRPSVTCLRFTRNPRDVKTSNLVEIYKTMNTGYWESKFKVKRSKVKVTGNENVKIVFR